MIKPRARLWVVVMALFLVAVAGACSNGDDEAETTPASSPEVTVTASSDTTSTTSPESPEAACIDVTHELGTSCVPADPQRIMVLDPLTALPTLIDLGLEDRIVGSLTVYPTGRQFPEYIEDSELTGIETAGSYSEPDIEEIALLDPDLIIGTASQVEPIQSQLETLAPTVAIPYAYYRTDWRDTILLVGKAVSREAETEAMLADLDAHVEQVRTVVDGIEGGFALSRIDIYQGAPLYYKYGCTFFGDILTGTGIAQPEAQESTCSGDTAGAAQAIVNLSLEQINVLDADAIVTYVQPSTEGAAASDPFEALAGSPLWQSLGVVERGDVYGFGDAWGLGADVRAAHIILTDLEETVLVNR